MRQFDYICDECVATETAIVSACFDGDPLQFAQITGFELIEAGWTIDENGILCPKHREGFKVDVGPVV